MKKTYKIEVDCANCANFMEQGANKIHGVKSAVVNYMTQKMVVEYEDEADIDACYVAIIRACKKVDRRFVMEEIR